MAGEEIKLNAKADIGDVRLTEPTLSRPNPLRGKNQTYSPGSLSFDTEKYYQGNPQLRAEAELAKGFQLKQPSFASDHQPLFASDKDGGAKITLGGKKDGDEKAEKHGERTKTAAAEKPGEPGFFAELLPDGTSVNIPTDIMRLDVSPSPQFGTVLASAADVRTA